MKHDILWLAEEIGNVFEDGLVCRNKQKRKSVNDEGDDTEVKCILKTRTGTAGLLKIGRTSLTVVGDKQLHLIIFIMIFGRARALYRTTQVVTEENKKKCHSSIVDVGNQPGFRKHEKWDYNDSAIGPSAMQRKC